MFGHRSDGKKVKNLPPIFRIIPIIMMERNDSQVYFCQDIPIKNMDEYINEKAQEGIKITYMNIIFAATVKIIHERPNLNRFAVNGRLYDRNKIYISLALKKNLTDDGEETSIKVEFDGTEDLLEVKEKLDKMIQENKNLDADNNVDKFAKFFNFIPTGILRSVVNFLKFLDKHGLLPKFIIALSPFHTSAFITNVGSLGIDSIYHHIYNFGTTSMFFAMGKKKKSYIYEDDEIKEEKCISIRFVGDERICDGYYFANSFKQFVKYLKKPKLLEKEIDNKEKVEETI